jgi:hypothetical protein
VIYRLILPQWAKDKPDWDKKSLPPVIEGELTQEEVEDYNRLGYNCYFLPNYPSQYTRGEIVEGSHIDVFGFVFVDMDLKHGDHADKESFVKILMDFKLEPTSIVDSGNGIHAYWSVNDLDQMSFLRLQRRLCRYFKSDDAVAKLYQLMRVPGTINWKVEDDLKLAELLHASGKEYTCEDLDKALPRISPEDEAYCQLHHDKTFGLVEQLDVSDELPAKWFKLAKKDTEPYQLFYGQVKDRSAADFRLGHLLFAAGFTKEEAMAVLMNTQKAATRSGVHRYNYAEGIISKIFTEIAKGSDSKLLSRSVRDILGDTDEPEGVRFPCNPYVDATATGFRLGHVLGLIGGAGSGKTTVALNLFHWFCERNPEYIHLFVSLEQPEREIAKRWRKMSGGNTTLYDSVHVLGNYNDDGTYRHLGLDDIEEYVKRVEKVTGKKVGCVVIDHIGVLKKETKNGEAQGLMDICQRMKSVAVNTNVFMVMQSQAPREKAGVGDVELDKDAAYGTSMFEWFCDYIVTTWQPLKRVYKKAPHMTVNAFKFCKIRHKDVNKDDIQEDTVYALKFDTETEQLRELNEDEKQAYSHYNTMATNIRKRDKKTDTSEVHNLDWLPKKREKNGRDVTNS